MTSGLALLAHWSVRQKLNRVSSVQLRRSVRALMQPHKNGVSYNHCLVALASKKSSACR